MINNHKISTILLLLGAFLSLGLTTTTDYSLLFLAGLLAVLVVIFFMRYPQIGIYLMLLLYPFNYWELYYGNLNVPYVDLVGLFLLISWSIKIVFNHFTGQSKLSLKNFPGWIFMALFAGTCALSLLNVESEMINYSIKYILRPIIFFYLIFVVLPFNILDTPKKLFIAFKTLFGLGLALSAMGIWSLIFPPIEGLRRVVPIAIFGFYPLGTNHNLFAEIFVCLIPITAILFWQEKSNLLLKNIYLLGGLVMVGVNLLTLSRAGWLVMMMQVLLVIALRYRREVTKFLSNYLTYLALALMTPFLYLMYELLNSYIVVSSNLNRLKLIDIAWDMFMANPLIGHGIGSFIVVVSGVKWYIIEYGGPLDAHGFLFKTLAEVGILGTLCFAALISYFLFKISWAYKKSRGQAEEMILLGLLLAALGVVVFQLTGTGYYLAKMWLPIGLAMAGAQIYNLKKSKI